LSPPSADPVPPGVMGATLATSTSTGGQGERNISLPLSSHCRPNTAFPRLQSLGSRNMLSSSPSGSSSSRLCLVALPRKTKCPAHGRGRPGTCTACMKRRRHPRPRGAGIHRARGDAHLFEFRVPMMPSVRNACVAAATSCRECQCLLHACLATAPPPEHRLHAQQRRQQQATRPPAALEDMSQAGGPGPRLPTVYPLPRQPTAARGDHQAVENLSAPPVSTCLTLLNSDALPISMMDKRRRRGEGRVVRCASSVVLRPLCIVRPSVPSLHRAIPLRPQGGTRNTPRASILN
jgi:hypothetical protein